MTLNLLDSWTRGDGAVRQVIPQLLGLTTVNAQSVESAGNLLGKFGKLALAVLGQFQIDNAFRNVYRALGLGTPLIGFYRCAAAVLGALALPADRIEFVNIPARIRNSLHANGIHHRQHPAETSTVEVRGVIFNFVDGEKVNCATWEHIAHALEASIGVLDEVFSHNQVIAIKDPMQDLYAHGESTAGRPVV